MKEELQEKDNEIRPANILKVLGLGLGLPSTILGIFALVYYLMDSGYISNEIAVSIIVLVIFYTFYLMYKYANKK